MDHSARLHERLEREAQRQRTEYIKELELDVSTWKETAATFEDFYRKTEAELEERRAYIEKLDAALKLHVFNLDKLSEAENRYLKAEAKLEALEALVRNEVRISLEYADVHPCDVNDDEVKARYLSENMRALYEAIK
jgi:hypothetical protein